MEGKKTLLVFVILVVYLAVGGVVFHFTESDNEESVRIDLQNVTQQIICKIFMNLFIRSSVKLQNKCIITVISM